MIYFTTTFVDAEIIKIINYKIKRHDHIQNVPCYQHNCCFLTTWILLLLWSFTKTTRNYRIFYEIKLSTECFANLFDRQFFGTIYIFSWLEMNWREDIQSTTTHVSCFASAKMLSQMSGFQNHQFKKKLLLF